MSDTKRFGRLVGLVLLYVLASPIFAFLWLRKVGKTLKAYKSIRTGWMVCPHCHERNPVDVLSTCRRCGVTEYGSRLYCTNCKQVTRSFDCSGCGATIKAL